MPQAGFFVFSRMLSVAQKSLLKLKNGKMERYGLGSAHTMCLCRLYESTEGLTKTRLAALCGVDKAQISRVIAELEEKEFVSANHKVSNYRQKYRLTEPGRQITGEIMDAIAEINVFVSGSIPREDLEIFYRTLKTICDNLTKAEALFLNDTEASAMKGTGVNHEEN